MIERYRKPEMTALWSDRERLSRWLKVEQAVLEALARAKVVPAADWKQLAPVIEKIATVGIDPEDVLAKEKTLKHDVIAFTAVVAELIQRYGGDKARQAGRFFHYGLTSSDVVDTAFSMTIQVAASRLLPQIQMLIKVLQRLAKKTQSLPTIGRTHGMFAEPTSFGMKFLGWAEEWKRNLERFERSVEQCRVGKLSGAVGASPHWDVAFERKALQALGLKREPISTQVIPRDRHAELMNTMALMGCSIERISIELRHLQRSELSELREGFTAGQKGSSAMPHKRNPISAENLSGCARLFRAYAQACMENVPLWHERDISHSSVERVVFPDAFQLMDYALGRLVQLLEGLEFVDANIQRNLELAGPVVFSGHLLLALVRKGATREDGYRWIQSCALQGNPTHAEFIQRIESHADISKWVTSKEVRELLDMKRVLRGVKENFENTDR